MRDKISIPNMPLHDELRLEYSDVDIKTMLQYILAPKGVETVYTHYYMQNNKMWTVLYLNIAIVFIPLVVMIYIYFTHDTNEISLGMTLLMLLVSIADMVYLF